MAIFKCKICGGSLDIDNVSSVATCEYCGTKQTLPKFDGERRANLYDRANHFRRNNDFDKAMGIYEIILNEDNTDAEAYWSIILCRYGIEYVEDPKTHKRVPTVNRAQFTSVFDDEDYKSAIAHADSYQRELYEAEAKTINEIQKGILAISQKEEPFDVFICYKETDKNGNRTKESVIATELYKELTDEGIKVFFSRITLEDKLGVAYEPYIFAALNSSKVMVALGTSSQNFNSAWVKNEWSRYLSLIKNGVKKTLIPAYIDMDPYDLPDEFSHLQAQDMAKLGAMQDMVRGIKKIIGFDERKTAVTKETVTVVESVATEPLFRRASMALADNEFKQADAFYEQILNQDPENADAYVGKLLAELRIKNKSELVKVGAAFDKSNNYKKAIQFGNEELKNELQQALKNVVLRLNNQKMDGIYRGAKTLFENCKDIPTCKRAKKFFVSISGYSDADEYAERCQQKIDGFQREWDQLRLEQQKNVKKRKKARIGSLITCFSLIVLIVSLFVTYVVVFRVSKPLSKCDDAMALVSERRYDEALAMLNEAKSEAWFDGNISKIDDAIATLRNAKAKQTTADMVLRDLKAKAKPSDSDYKNTINRLIDVGFSVRIVYQCEGGELTDKSLIASEQIYGKGSTFSGFYKAERSGYTFKSWSLEQAEYQPVDGNCLFVLKASWTEQIYTIKYKLDPSEAYKTIKYSIEDNDVTLPIPKKVGYTFLGWEGDGLDEPTVKVVIPKGSHGNRFYTATWKVNDYKITFDPVGGTCSTSNEIYTYGTVVDLPTPQREGFNFVGWIIGNEYVKGAWTVNVTAHTTLKAVWSTIKYKINYDLRNVPTNHFNASAYTVVNTVNLEAPVYNEYATFMGWYTDKDFTNRITSIPEGSTGDITLYAKWDFQVFTIEYDWNGGEEVSTAKKTFTVADLPLSLCKPTKSGHTFYYWALDDIDGEMIDSIEECKNYKLVANYIIDGLSVSWLSGSTYPYSSWCEAKYSGDAEEITIPKYHRLTYSCATPYIISIDVSSANNLKRISFSDNVEGIEFSSNTPLEFKVYENGCYLGSRNNPYYALMKKADESLSVKKIHEDTVAISDLVFKNDDTLTSIVIPKNVKFIEEFAFSNSHNLVEVYNLSSLDVYAERYYLKYLRVVHTSLDEPSRVSEYGDYVVYFDAEANLYEILRYIGEDIDVILPDNINGCDYTIGCRFLGGRTDVTSVVIPDGAVGIGSEAFYGCTGLKSVSLSSRITNIGVDAFYQCTSLVEVILPESLVEIGSYAFYGCNSLRSVTFYENLVKVGRYAFSYCDKLLEVYNLSSVDIKDFTHLEMYVKVEHTSLDEPSCWIEQGDYLFFVSEENDIYLLCGYSGNESVLVLPESINGHSYSIYDYAFKGNTDITELTVSDGVVGIGEQAFASCTNLSKVYIGKDVSIIEEKAFSSCSALVSAEFADVEGWGMYHSSSIEKEYTASDIENVENAVTILRSLGIYDSLRKK